MANIKALAGQTAIYGVSTILSRLLNYALVPLHVYIFKETADYGVVGELYAWVSLVMVFLTYGTETAFFRYAKNEIYKDKLVSTIATSLFITSLIFIVLATVCSTTIAGWLRYENHPEYVTWFALIIGIDAFTSIFFASLRQRLQAIKFAAVKITNIVVNVIMNLFFLLLFPYLLEKQIAVELVNAIYSPAVGVGYIFISNLIASIVTFLMLFPELLKIKLSFSWQLWKMVMIYALPLLAFNLAGIVNETMDRILIRRLSPPDMAQSQVGIYSACYKISILMTIFVQAFKYAAEPFFFKKSNDKDAKQTYSDVMSIFVLLLSVIFLGIMLYIDIVQYFVSANYRVGLKVVPILLLANLCLGVFYNLSIWYKLTDKTRFGAYIAIFGAVITLSLNFWLIPIMGYMGSAYATLICYFSMVVISFFFGKKYYPVDYKILRILSYVIGSIVVWQISTLFSIDNIYLKLSANTLLLLCYLSIVVFFDKKYLFALIKR
ncbi:MAG: oligosaccharide flippase family protein [Bacteroidales bacterium]|nr:oligosaccharide flippase family protein [Bacteroidales bacterium]